MRFVSVFSIITLLFIGFSLMAIDVSAGPLIVGKGPLTDVRKQISDLIHQAVAIERLLSNPVTNPTVLLDLLRESEVGLTELEAKLQLLIASVNERQSTRLGFILARLSSFCGGAIAGLRADLAKTPLVLEAAHIQKFIACRKQLQKLSPHRPTCFGSLICPIRLSTQASIEIYTFQGKLVIHGLTGNGPSFCALPNGVHLAVKTYSDRRREIEKLIILR